MKNIDVINCEISMISTKLFVVQVAVMKNVVLLSVLCVIFSATDYYEQLGEKQILRYQCTT